MGRQSGYTLARGWLLVVAMAIMVAVPPLPAGAAAPPTSGPPPPVSGTPPSTQDPRLPDHRAEAQYFASMRQAPAGISPAKARLAAQQQAKGLPTLATLPPAIGPAGTVTAPTRDTLYAPAGSWQPLGPASEDTDQANPSHDYRFGRTSGRTTAVVVGSHTGVIYLGTADGGVWKSTNDGVSWTVLTDGQPSLAVGALALDPADSLDNTLYVGTGETNSSGDEYFGVGVLKTTDGGATWTLLGQSVFGGGTYSANSIGFDVLNVDGSTIRAGTTNGMFQSTDGGTTWSQIVVLAGSSTARVTDMAIDSSVNPHIVYAVLSEANPGPAYTGIYKSTDGGASNSFDLITSGLPATSGWGRTRLALAQGAPQTLYLAITNGNDLIGVYKTTNGGTLWAATTGAAPNFVDAFPPDGQAFYDVFIIVDPTDANHVYAGGVYMVATTDGGTNWAVTADVYCLLAPSPHFPCRGPIHPDQHAGFMPAAGPHAGALYVANDGGIWKTTNPNAGTGTTWTDLNANINTMQFYAGDVAANFTTTPIVAGGAQDNGTSRGASATAGVWNAILGGDGGYVAIDKLDPNITYAEYQNGRFWKTTNANGGTLISWTELSLSCGATLFIAPFVLDPNHSSHLAFGGGAEVCESTDSGTTWHTINTNTLSSEIQSVAIAPSNAAVIYAGTDNGHIWRTTAGNSGSASVWTDLSASLPVAPVTAIAIDPADANTAYATFGNFGVGHVWKTTNGGTLWTNITHNLPDIPTTSVVTFPSFPSPVLVVGTDIGIYASVDGGTTWQTLASGLPNVGIQQLFIDQAHTTLFAATHGRGMWEIGIPTVTSIGLTGLPATSRAGNAVTFTVTARNAANATVPEYIDTVHFTSTDSAAVLPPDYTFTGSGVGKDNGTHTFSVTFGTGGTQSVTVTDTYAGALTAQASTTVAPIIADISPASGGTAGGNTVTIIGAGFGTNAAQVTVTFGATAATIKSVSATQLVISAPAGSGTVVVAVTVNGIGATPSGSYTYGAVSSLPGTKPGSGNGSPNPIPGQRPAGVPSGGTPDSIPQGRP